ncbi:MAG: hypothetical protein EA349_04155 [Halomonadaceae bacterium]|nr:MAG: hypothetical protein EA349_04155 [Halomonadaceae bacterium]
MMGGIPGNTLVPLPPDSGQDLRTRRLPPGPDGDPRSSADREGGDRPGQILNNDAIRRRVESLGALENGRLQTLDPEGLPLRNQQALATFAAVLAGSAEDEPELVGLDLRV